MNRPNETRKKSLFRLRESLDTLLATIQTEWNVPPERIHMLGFSQGGTVALDYTLYVARRFSLGTCTAINAPLFPDLIGAYREDFQCETQIILSYGQYDKVVNDQLRNATVSVAYLRSQKNPCR
jgi:predicted esterase